MRPTLAGRACRRRAIVELAIEDDGARVTAAEMPSARTRCSPLDRAARRALVAACSPEVWPRDVTRATRIPGR